MVGCPVCATGSVHRWLGGCHVLCCMFPLCGAKRLEPVQLNPSAVSQYASNEVQGEVLLRSRAPGKSSKRWSLIVSCARWHR